MGLGSGLRSRVLMLQYNRLGTSRFLVAWDGAAPNVLFVLTFYMYLVLCGKQFFCTNGFRICKCSCPVCLNGIWNVSQ